MTRKLAHDIYRLAWPVLIAQLAVMAYAVIDTMMAGRFATEDLAAVGIGASIYFSVFVALMGVLLAVTPTVSQLLGAGRHDEIGEQVRQAMWLTLALAVLSIFVYSFPEPLLAMSQAPPESRPRCVPTSRSRRGARRRGSRFACSRATPLQFRFRAS
jgi:MATE family multidrug resistance protein